jgi:hypothetical protein
MSWFPSANVSGGDENEIVAAETFGGAASGTSTSALGC